MPEYIYTCDSCHKSSSKNFRMGKAPKSRRCRCGSKAHRDFAAEHGRMHVAEYGPTGKTWYDIAAHPEDVEKEKKLFKSIGVGIDIKPDGGIVCYSDKQRQKVLRVLRG